MTSLILRVSCPGMLPPGWDAATLGPVENFRGAWDADLGLLAHEDEHVGEFWLDPVGYSTRYAVDPMFAMLVECRCYAKQAKVYKNLGLFPGFSITALGYMGAGDAAADLYHWPAVVTALVPARFAAELSTAGVTS